MQALLISGEKSTVLGLDTEDATALATTVMGAVGMIEAGLLPDKPDEPVH